MLPLEQLLSGLVIPVDKPRQWSSFQAVGKVRGAIRSLYDTKKFKIGHAGTLDPLASGLLLVCVGRATKRIDELQQGEKIYSGTLVLGATTPCHDLERPIDHYYPFAHITQEDIVRAAEQLTGEIEQVPPVFSAVKIDGVRAYQYARQATDGEEVLPTPKKVTIHEFQITGFRQGDASFTPSEIASSEPHAETNLYKNPLGTVPEGLPQVDFRIRCGKGTYIRSLARDLGAMLGSGAFLSSLRRERVGDYSISEACPVENVREFLQSL